jgi:hypothetical protein
LTDLIESNTRKDGHVDHEEDIAASAAVTYAGGSLYTIFFEPHDLFYSHLGGSDTVGYMKSFTPFYNTWSPYLKTVSAICSFLLAVVLHPEVQKCGQEELNRVIGHDRLPTFDDRPALPYIEGIVKEVFRWILMKVYFDISSINLFFTSRWNPVVPAGHIAMLRRHVIANPLSRGNPCFGTRWCV